VLPNQHLRDGRLIWEVVYFCMAAAAPPSLVKKKVRVPFVSYSLVQPVSHFRNDVTVTPQHYDG